MKQFRLLSIMVVCFLCTAISYAHDHNHKHPANEIGISYGASYCPEHKEWGSGCHIHYFHTLPSHEKWSLGGGLETVWSDGAHYNISAGVKYEIIEDLSLGVLPGVTFLKHEEDKTSSYKSQFAIHGELVYALLQLGAFHLGPAIDYSWTKHDAHFMFGVHFAYGFK